MAVSNPLAIADVAEVFFDRTPRVLGTRVAEPITAPQLRWQPGMARRLVWIALALLLLTQITMAFAVLSPAVIDALIQVRRVTWLAVAAGTVLEVLAGDPSDLLGPVAAFVPYVAVGITSALLSVEPMAGLAEIALWLITLLAACLVGLKLRSANLPAVLAAWFAAVLLVSIVVVLVFPRIGMTIDGRIARGVWRGVFVSKNWLAWYAGFAVLLAVFAVSVRRVVRLGLGAMAVACLYYAHSAGTVLALVAVLAVLAMVAFWRRLGLSTGLQIVANGLVLGFAGIAGWGGYQAVLAALGRNATLTGRTPIWQAYFTRALDNWLFGAGPASFTELSLTTADIGLKFQSLGKIFTPHNMFIAIFGETGLIGLIAYLAAFVVILGGVLRNPSGQGRSLLLAWTVFFLVSGLDETHEVFGIGSGLFLIILLRAWQWPDLHGRSAHASAAKHSDPAAYARAAAHPGAPNAGI